MDIVHATSEAELASVRMLFEDYAASLAVDLGYQGFVRELAELPGAYAMPRGRLLLASEGGIGVGCVALRPLEGSNCEMKRLYVRPERQGLGVGRKLVLRLVAEARSIGYQKVLLDTLPDMQGALRLYESLGFARRTAYFETPIEGNVFMELNLHGPGAAQ